MHMYFKNVMIHRTNKTRRLKISTKLSSCTCNCNIYAISCIICVCKRRHIPRQNLALRQEYNLLNTCSRDFWTSHGSILHSCNTRTLRQFEKLSRIFLQRDIAIVVPLWALNDAINCWATWDTRRPAEFADGTQSRCTKSPSMPRLMYANVHSRNENAKLTKHIGIYFYFFCFRCYLPTNLPNRRNSTVPQCHSII